MLRYTGRMKGGGMRKVGTAGISLLTVAMVLVLAGTATGLGQKGPQSYYLALGDSIAYGVDPGKAGRPSPSNTGYVDPFAAHLRKLSPKIAVVNYGCPGESSVTFTGGGCPWLREGGKLHDPFRGAQLKAALSFLRAHKGQVSPITLTLWGNDLAPLSAKGKRAPKAIASFASRLDSILEQLRSAAPAAEIIVTGAWNLEADQAKKTEPLYRSLDAAIARTAAASRAKVAKMYAVFTPPGNLRRICVLSYICSKGDPHPNDAGYRAMANAFFAASGYGR
jgi:lysophospholipase L1-like esterase